MKTIKPSSVKVVFIATPKNKNRGYIQIRVIQNRKTKRKSLGFSIAKTHWDFNKQRVLSSLRKDYKKYNEIIEEALDEMQNNYGNVDYLTKPQNDIIEYWTNHNKNTINAGTKANREANLNKFKAFLKKLKIISLNFQEISPQLVESYQFYLTEQLSIRSVNTYLGYFKSVVNKAIREELVYYKVHPFIKYKSLTNKRKKTRALTHHQIKEMMEISLPPKQQYIRDMFCFQILSGGMRIRDLILLKWKNIVFDNRGIYLEYIQSKTKKELNPKLNYKALTFLNNILKENKPEQFIGLKNTLELLQSQEKLLNEQIASGKYDEFSKSAFVDFNHYDYQEKRYFHLNGLTENQANRLSLEQNINMYKEDLMSEYKLVLKNIIENDGDSYIFNLMDGIVVPENNTNEKIKNKIQGKIGIYNYHLKKIGQSCGINHITSHQARHSYAQLMVNNNVDLFLIMHSLGHSGPQVTQNYLNSIDNIQLDNISDKIAENF